MIMLFKNGEENGIKMGLPHFTGGGKMLKWVDCIIHIDREAHKLLGL